MRSCSCNKITLVQFGQNSNSAISARYLSGILRSYGYKVAIVCIGLSKKQGNGPFPGYCYRYLSDDAVKTLFDISRGSLFIGFTVYSFVAHIVKGIYTSRYNPGNIPIIVGGPHPTLNPYHASFFSDYVCVGDGEKAIVELAQRLSEGSPLASGSHNSPVVENIFSSVALRKDGDQGVIYGKEAAIDSESLPDYSFESEYYMDEAGLKIITKENAAKYVNLYATFFSRGCAYNCSFCSHEIIAQRSGFRKRIKSKEVTHFAKELKTIRSNYPWMNRVVFFDPNILSNSSDSLKYILNEYRLNVRLPLSVTGFTFGQINEGLFRDFLNAGVRNVTFGIESASQKTRVLYNRHESMDQIIKIDALNQRLKKDFFFLVQYDVIVDSPWEHPDDAMESVSFVSQLKGYDYLDIFSLRFFPGTKLFQKAAEEGILKNTDIDMYNQQVYRAMDYTYENFLLLLLRDGLLRGRWLFVKATRPRAVRIMRKFFKRYGKYLFIIYTSNIVSMIIKFIWKITVVWRLINAVGLRQAFKILKDIIQRKTHTALYHRNVQCQGVDIL